MVMVVDKVREMKELLTENTRLKQLVAKQALPIGVLKWFPTRREAVAVIEVYRRRFNAVHSPFLGLNLMADIFGAGRLHHGRHAREPVLNLRQYVGAIFSRRHELCCR